MSYHRPFRTERSIPGSNSDKEALGALQLVLKGGIALHEESKGIHNIRKTVYLARQNHRMSCVHHHQTTSSNTVPQLVENFPLSVHNSYVVKSVLWGESAIFVQTIKCEDYKVSTISVYMLKQSKYLLISALSSVQYHQKTILHVRLAITYMSS